MTMQRSELRDEIYGLLQRDATAPGLLTPTKVNSAIQDSFDYIATKMMKINGGWLTGIAYCDIEEDDNYVTLPTGLVLINFVKIKDNSTGDYVPIEFGENADGVTLGTTQGGVGSSYRPRWRFSSGALFLEPKPDADLDEGIMIDGMFYPDQLTGDSALIDGDMNNRAFIQYAKWRSAAQLFRLANGLAGDAATPFDVDVAEWKQSVIETISRRHRMPTPIKAIDY